MAGVTYGNSYVLQYTYDNFGNIATVKNGNNAVLVKNLSDASGNIIRTQDLVSDLEHRLSYDSTGRLLSKDVLDLTKTHTTDKWLRSIEYDFDENNNLTKLALASKNGSNLTTHSYKNDNDDCKDNLPTVTTLQNGKTVTYTHDPYGRLTRKELDTSNHLIYTYDYMDSERDGDYTTTKIKTESIGENKYEYTYDVYGNIKQIYFIDSEGDKTCKYTYTYDSNNQLTAVNDKVANTYTTYTYDESGNITRKYVQNLHPTNGYPIGVQSDVAYSYTDSSWKDLLTSYNGQTITYDAIGNPLSYRDGITLTWQNGRELASYTDSDTNVTYTYDASGMRTGKTINGIGKVNYVYENGLLMQMEHSGYILDFSYDANGTPVSVRMNIDGTMSYYYYGVNFRGDIVSIYNVAGGEVVQYTYDAYGKLLSTSATPAYTSIATINPLRYRGYVYDRETGLYYLQSRYYDPETCRFINEDIQLNIDTFNGFNQFAYCNNNPVMCFDPTGTDAIVLLDNYFVGHIGALVEDANGDWHHTYWGAPGGIQLFPSSASISQLTGGCACVLYTGDTPDLHNKNLLNEINQSNGPFSGYDDYFYLYGDYSSCIETLANPPERYDLLSNNCSQFTIGTLAQVENHNTYSLHDAQNIISPKKAFKTIKNTAVQCDEYWYKMLTFKENYL